MQSPGKTKIIGTASAAAAAVMITSAMVETPNASANATTIAAPRSTYRVPATRPRLVPITCNTLETGRISTAIQATIPHTQPSPMAKSLNRASGAPSGSAVNRRWSCHASARPATVCSASMPGHVRLTKRTIGSYVAYVASIHCGGLSFTSQRIV